MNETTFEERGQSVKVTHVFSVLQYDEASDLMRILEALTASGEVVTITLPLIQPRLRMRGEGHSQDSSQSERITFVEFNGMVLEFELYQGPFSPLNFKVTVTFLIHGQIRMHTETSRPFSPETDIERISQIRSSVGDFRPKYPRLSAVRL